MAALRINPLGSLPIPCPRPYEEVADGEMFRLCPVRASGASAAMVPEPNSGIAGERGFDPLRRHCRASDADEKASR